MNYNINYTCCYRNTEDDNMSLVEYQYDLLKLFYLESNISNDEDDFGDTFETITERLYILYENKLKKYVFMNELLKKKSEELFQEDCMTGLTLFYSYLTLDIFHEIIKLLYEIDDQKIEVYTLENIKNLDFIRKYSGDVNYENLEKLHKLIVKLNI